MTMTLISPPNTPSTVSARKALSRMFACGEARSWVMTRFAMGHSPNQIWQECPDINWRLFVLDADSIQSPKGSPTPFKKAVTTAYGEWRMAQGHAHGAESLNRSINDYAKGYSVSVYRATIHFLYWLPSERIQKILDDQLSLSFDEQTSTITVHYIPRGPRPCTRCSTPTRAKDGVCRGCQRIPVDTASPKAEEPEGGVIDHTVTIV